MAPKFWIEFSRFTITCLRLMDIAPLDRFTVTIIGSISGVRPTATDRPKRSASPQSCLVSPTMTKTTETITTMKRIISQVKLSMPRSKLVGTRWPARRAEMAPKQVRAPVFTTTARAVPESTLEPWKHVFARSIAFFPAVSTGAAVFSMGIDSPVSAAWLT